MLNQFEDMLINGLVQKLQSHGINIDAETIKKAAANSPQIIKQVEQILLSSSSTDRLEKISALLKQAASGDTSTTGTGTSSTTTTNQNTEK